MSASAGDAASGMLQALEQMRHKGVKLWCDNGELRYAAPKGALTRDDIEGLKRSKNQILALLVQSEPRRRAYRAPLAFSQQAHWQLYGLSTRPAIRQIAFALRLHGPLNARALESALSAIVARQDALRTRVVCTEGGAPMQEVAAPDLFELPIEDLRAMPESLREPATHEHIDALILEPIDVARGPLFGARLLRITEREHVLILVMEHMISDGFSRSILTSEILSAYPQAVAGRTLSLPTLPVQFAEYARQQRSSLPDWLATHGRYWTDRLRDSERLRFPEDRSAVDEPSAGWGSVPVHIGRDLKQQLIDFSRASRSTLVLSVFTAFAALVLRWCRASHGIVQLQSDGRASAELQHTIGYFATALYLHIDLDPQDRFPDLLRRVTDEYCRAYEHVDYSYWTAQVPRPEFARNSAFNWLPYAPNAEGVVDCAAPFVCTPVSFEHPMMRGLQVDHEPSIRLCELEHEIVGAVHFPRNRFSSATMERFAGTFTAFLQALTSPYLRRVLQIELHS